MIAALDRQFQYITYKIDDTRYNIPVARHRIHDTVVLSATASSCDASFNVLYAIKARNARAEALGGIYVQAKRMLVHGHKQVETLVRCLTLGLEGHTTIANISQRAVKTKVFIAVDRYAEGVVKEYTEYMFKKLVEQWYSETEYTSSITRIVSDPSYQRIIGMGPDVVPLILRQIESEGDDPGHWGWALSSITGENPVPDEAAGDPVKIAEAWVLWGRSRYAW